MTRAGPEEGGLPTRARPRAGQSGHLHATRHIANMARQRNVPLDQTMTESILIKACRAISAQTVKGTEITKNEPEKTEEFAGGAKFWAVLARWGLTLPAPRARDGLCHQTRLHPAPNFPSFLFLIDPPPAFNLAECSPCASA